MEIIRDVDDGQGKPPDEEGIEIPLARVNPDTLRSMLLEFVTRECADEECTLERRVEQVLRRLREGKAKIMYDFKTETWNIVESK